MSDLFGHSSGATPLTPEDREGLIPTWVATRRDLNLAEQRNIAQATGWAFDRRWRVRDFTQRTLRSLHRRMFDEVWRWAGSYRRIDTNVGVPWAQIPGAVEAIVLDVVAQTADPSALPWTPDETAIRFHHRLVSVHPFPNGNGRHARLTADLLLIALGEPRLGWAQGASLATESPERSAYLDALRAADHGGDFEPLVEFARRGRPTR